MFFFFLLSTHSAIFHFWKFSSLWYEVGVQSRFARGQRWFCDPFLVRCSSVLPRCNAVGSGSPSTVPELPQKHTGTSLPSWSPMPGVVPFAVVTGRNSPGCLHTLLAQQAIVLGLTVTRVGAFTSPLQGNQNFPTTGGLFWLHLYLLTWFAL